MLSGTVFAACEDLAQARGLAGVVHHGPSSIDLATLRAGLSELPLGFLNGTGVESSEIEQLRDLWAATTR